MKVRGWCSPVLHFLVCPLCFPNIFQFHCLIWRVKENLGKVSAWRKGFKKCHAIRDQRLHARVHKGRKHGRSTFESWSYFWGPTHGRCGFLSCSVHKIIFFWSCLAQEFACISPWVSAEKEARMIFEFITEWLVLEVILLPVLDNSTCVCQFCCGKCIRV